MWRMVYGLIHCISCGGQVVQELVAVEHMVHSSWVAGSPWSVNGGAYGWRELHHVTKWVRLVHGEGLG